MPEARSQRPPRARRDRAAAQAARQLSSEPPRGPPSPGLRAARRASRPRRRRDPGPGELLEAAAGPPRRHPRRIAAASCFRRGAAPRRGRARRRPRASGGSGRRSRLAAAGRGPPPPRRGAGCGRRARVRGRLPKTLPCASVGRLELGTVSSVIGRFPSRELESASPRVTGYELCSAPRRECNPRRIARMTSSSDYNRTANLALTRDLGAARTRVSSRRGEPGHSSSTGHQPI